MRGSERGKPLDAASYGAFLISPAERRGWPQSLKRLRPIMPSHSGNRSMRRLFLSFGFGACRPDLYI
ncbi:hypothetical protein CLOLEP_01454 [[Clostridium] leptum DSM 753]|uniref:Uncharacterized protein n=1 Tax=[Clostridium] leptum DSM 753 TaxID=428125 RepID=A7VSB3_9FIRM|nr:hypothetical protein CLOLEP_01454 [[Clostridium] leptum DSM 753]